MKYAGSVTIVDDEGNIVHERELDADEMIEELITSWPSEQAEEVPRATAAVVDAVLRGPTFNKPKTERKKGEKLCKRCGKPGHMQKTCPEGSDAPEEKSKGEMERDADARLRVKRMVEGGIDNDEIKSALKRAGFVKLTEREVEEMIAWAQK